MQELSKLLDAGYEVAFAKAESGYVASVDSDAASYWHTAIADTPGEALWAASPLHAEDEPYPGKLEDRVQALVERVIAVEAVFEAGREAGPRSPLSADIRPSHMWPMGTAIAKASCTECGITWNESYSQPECAGKAAQ